MLELLILTTFFITKHIFYNRVFTETQYFLNLIIKYGYFVLQTFLDSLFLYKTTVYMKGFKLLPLFFLLCVSFIKAQEIEQFEVFSGRFDYLAIGNTLNAFENGTFPSCVILSESSATLNLEADQTIIAAYLYWAGSGDGDFNVELNDQPITATRTFTDSTINPVGSPITFFSGFAEVTDILVNSTTTEYTFSGLDLVDISSRHCNFGTNFGGWSIVVVYEDMDLPINQVNLFDGFERVSQFNPILNITLDNLNVVDNENARVGFLAWEGDRSIDDFETIRFNGTLLSNPPLNPSDNQFNGTNSFTGATDLFNMDIDVYNIQNTIGIGDDTAIITLTSARDVVFINSIVTVLNSQLPDAVISIDNVQTVCNNRDITFDYIATNQGTDILLAGTQISFYGDGVLTGTTTIPTALGLGEFFEDTITISINQNIPNDFVFQAIIDDPAIMVENNEDNNESNEITVVLEELIVGGLEDVFVCDDFSNDGVEIFNLTEVAENAILSQDNISIEFYRSMNNAETQTSPIVNPESYQNVADQETIFVRYSLTNNLDCVLIRSFEVEVFFQPEAPIINPFQVCDDASNDGIEVLDLSIFETTILGTQTPEDFSITFHNTQQGAETNTSIITPITNVSLANGESVFARIENVNNISCFDTTEITFVIDTAPFANPVITQVLCDDPSNDDIEDFDLTGLDSIILGDQSSVDFTVTFHNTQDDADTNTGAITPINAVSQTNGSSLFARIENNSNSSCFDTTEIIFIVDTALIVESIPDQIVCDDISNDGVEVFDLSTLEIIVLGLQNPEDFTTTFHNNEADANANTASLPNITSVSLANGDSVFVRYQNDIFDSCFGITEINFVVNAAPIANEVPDQIVCDDLFNDEVALFDLSILDSTVIGDQTGMLLTYHETLEDAETGENSIVNPDDYNNTTNPQMIYTRLENELNPSCFDIDFFDLVILPINDIVTFEPMVSCNDGFETGVFDLTSLIPSSNLEGFTSDLVTDYYTSLEDADNQINPIIDPNNYQNTSSPQVVSVRFQRDTEDCFEVGQFTLDVEAVSYTHLTLPTTPYV